VTVPRIVDEVVGAYLSLVDAEVPGLVEGLYLVGSIGLGDFRLRSSDIDYVAVTAAPPSPAGVAGLGRVHARLRGRYPRPHFDGAYVTWADRAGDPAAAGPGPGSHGGRLRPSAASGAPDPHAGHSPVTWHMVARHAVARRGPDPAALTVHADPAALAAWCDRNLDTYWRPWLARWSPLASPRGLFALTPYAAVWAVTGVARLHYTLATGGITSKAGAARYALEAFPSRWHRAAREALRLRQGDAPGARQYRTPFARRRDVLAFADMAIADAHRVFRNA
jgi:hypothetical protein